MVIKTYQYYADDENYDRITTLWNGQAFSILVDGYFNFIIWSHWQRCKVNKRSPQIWTPFLSTCVSKRAQITRVSSPFQGVL